MGCGGSSDTTPQEKIIISVPAPSPAPAASTPTELVDKSDSNVIEEKMVTVFAGGMIYSDDARYSDLSFPDRIYPHDEFFPNTFSSPEFHLISQEIKSRAVKVKNIQCNWIYYAYDIVLEPSPPRKTQSGYSVGVHLTMSKLDADKLVGLESFQMETEEWLNRTPWAIHKPAACPPWVLRFFN